MKKYFFLSLLVLIGISCRKNIEEDEVIIDKPGITILTVASFKGHVLDENETPVIGAIVEINDNVAVTNSAGKFVFDNIEVNQERVIIKAFKDGFFIGSSTVTVQSQTLCYAQVNLSNKGTPKVFSAQEETSIADQGLTLKIPANSLLDANNNPYLGEVTAFAKYLAPNNAKLAELMPGELIGVDNTGKKTALSTLGILRTEFTNAAGEKLKLDPAKNLEITFPLSPETAALIPTTGVPIWRYNYDLGLWAKDDGTCANTGTCSGYPGTISICFPFDAIKISGYVYHNDGSPASSVIASLKGDDNYYRFRWLTNAAGYFETLAPKDMMFNYTIEDHCLNTLFGQSAGTFSDDAMLNDVTLDSTIETFQFVMSGTTLDCNNTPLANAMVEIRFPGNRAYFFTNSDGTFNQSINFPCSSFPEIIVNAYDITNKKRSANFIIDVASDLNVGNLVACQEPEDYFEVEYNDTTYFLFPTHGKYFETIDPLYKEYNIMSKTIGGVSSLILEDFTDNTTTTTGRFSILNQSAAPLYFTASTTIVDINITDSTDDFFIGTFTGSLGPETITGSFKSRK